MYVFVRVGSLIRLLAVLAVILIAVVVLYSTESPSAPQREITPDRVESVQGTASRADR